MAALFLSIFAYFLTSVMLKVKKHLLRSVKITNHAICSIRRNPSKFYATELCKHKHYKDLTYDDLSKIDSFWSKYGVKFPDNSWFKMFYNETGNKSPTFIPHPIASVLFSYYNDRNAQKGWDDKNMYEVLIPSLTFPLSYCHYIHGHLYDSNWKEIRTDDASIKKFADSLYKIISNNRFILKKTTNTSFGHGVKLYSFKQPSDITEIICQSINVKSDFIIQECIEQHSFLKQFNSTSVNIFRIITFRHNETINYVSCSIRFGTEGHYSDIAFIDGREITNVVGVDSNGYIKTKQFGIYGEVNFEKYNQIAEKQVPRFNDLINMALDGHKHLPHFDFVAWDFTIDKECNPICIEYNINYPGTQLYQFVNGPLMGDLTETFLEPLKLPEVRKHIPSEYIIRNNRYENGTRSCSYSNA